MDWWFYYRKRNFLNHNDVCWQSLVNYIPGKLAVAQCTYSKRLICLCSYLLTCTSRLVVDALAQQLELSHTPIADHNLSSLFLQRIRWLWSITCCGNEFQVQLQGGPAKVRPTYIFAGSIWMHRRNSMIFGKCKLHTTRSSVMQILSKFCHKKHLTR